MAEIVRTDVVANDEDLYRKNLEERVAALKYKPWKDLTAEEKDAIAELSAYRLGYVRAG